MHPITGWLPILTRAKQMKSLERNERITLRQVTRIYHWFRSVQLHFIILKLILSVHVIYQKCVIFISQIWIFDEMRESHNVSKIGLIFSALSKSACGGLVRQVRHFVQPWRFVYVFKSILFLVTHGLINFTSLKDTSKYLGTNTLNSITVSTKYVSLPDMSDVCLTFTMQFYNGLNSIVRQMSDVSLPQFAYTAVKNNYCEWAISAIS